MKIKKGDKVKVISGKDKGKIGNVVAVVRSTSKVVVEGVNMLTKFEKKQSETKKGGIRKEEAPIYASKVQIVDENGKASRVGFKVEGGKKVRIAKKTNKQLS